MSQEKHI